MACTGCQVLPPVERGAGILYLAAALPHTQRSLRQHADSLQLDYYEPHDRLLGVLVARDALDSVVVALSGGLSGPEVEACRAVFVAEGAEFGLAQLKDTRPLRAFAAQAGAGWLREMIEEQRLISHFQPIVHAAAPERVFAYECLLRGRDAAGALVFPDRLFPAARAAEMMFHLDHAARLTAIRESEKYDVDTPIFINFNPTAIYDPAFCLRTTIEAAHRSGRPGSAFVFEVVESDEVRDPGHLLRILATYREAGFRVALDDLGAGYGSLNLLADIRPDFVKLDRALVANVHADPYRASVVTKLLEAARELGITTIAEGIEAEEEWQWLRERGCDLVQGYLFARPASPPPAPRLLAAAV